MPQSVEAGLVAGLLFYPNVPADPETSARLKGSAVDLAYLAGPDAFQRRSRHARSCRSLIHNHAVFRYACNIDAAFDDDIDPAASQR